MYMQKQFSFILEAYFFVRWKTYFHPVRSAYSLRKPWWWFFSSISLNFVINVCNGVIYLFIRLYQLMVKVLVIISIGLLILSEIDDNHVLAMRPGMHIHEALERRVWIHYLHALFAGAKMLQNVNRMIIQIKRRIKPFLHCQSRYNIKNHLKDKHSKA